ncbi:MAG TPA: response regulator, partial [Patescibacteria group bacterium]|nr:response regulator [Patescibacteria group bacterium]
AKNKKILIVEDERALLLVLADKFRREGFLTLEAEDGHSALDAATNLHPDLILLDLVMPGMDGLAMLKKLREDKWGNRVPVLILSNLSDPEQISEANGRGVIEYMVKSNWGLDDVVGKVKQTLGIR